jgi:hypothetical protein
MLPLETLPPPPRSSEWGSSLPPDCFYSPAEASRITSTFFRETVQEKYRCGSFLICFPHRSRAAVETTVVAHARYAALRNNSFVPLRKIALTMN